MSYVSIYQIDSGGDFIQTGEAQNSSGFASFVWDVLTKKYGLIRDNEYALVDGVLKILWAMAGTGKLEPDEEILLQATFDYVCISPENARKLSDACEAFYAKYGKGKTRTLLGLAKVIRETLAGYPNC